MRPSHLYTAIILTAFLALAIVFLCLPRSVYSELEKRELATFPEFSPEKLKDAKYTTELSQWFSDTEPYRDVFMAMSMSVRDKLRYSFSENEETISFHTTDNSQKASSGDDASSGALTEYENHVNANENAKIASAGIIIVGKAPYARALNAFGGSPNGGIEFSNVVSQYAQVLPGVKVYAMVVPLSSEFYMPTKAQSSTKPQLPVIKNIYANLRNGARGVNAYNALGSHVKEDIYLRTDHHWAPLGAFYAAEAFAKEAGVDFKPLSAYRKKTIKGYIGSMYGYSKDMAIKNSPEDLVYYVPDKITYSTTYRDYKVNKDYQVTAEGPEVKGEFFYHYKDGSPGAYCTFMGGDQRLTHVKTSTRNGRKLLIIKDSYGNPIPSFLFYSFEDIFVVDFRYFTRNMKKFVNDNGVTDLLFAVNIFNAYSGSAAQKMKKFLTQGDGTFAKETPAETPNNGKEASSEKQNSTRTRPASDNLESEKESYSIKSEGSQPEKGAAAPTSAPESYSTE